MKIGIFAKADGKLQTQYEGDAPSQHLYGGPWGDPEQCVHLEIPEGLDQRCISLLVTPADGETPEALELVEDAEAKAAYQEQDAIANTERVVANAISRGQALLTEFSAENIRLGITVDGQTGIVLNKLQGVLAAMQTGSLYEAIARIKAVDAADYDAKYVTGPRLLAFANKIETYLGIELSTAWY